MINLDDIGYYLFMEEQEQKDKEPEIEIESNVIGNNDFIEEKTSTNEEQKLKNESPKMQPPYMTLIKWS